MWAAGQEGPSRHQGPSCRPNPGPNCGLRLVPRCAASQPGRRCCHGPSWCAARSIEAMHAPAVKLHHLAAQFYLTLAPTRHSNPAPSRTSVRNSTWCRLLPHQTCTRPAPDLRACITHTHAACLALPCLALDSATRPLLLTNFRSRRGLTLTFLQVPFTSTPTARCYHHHHRPRHPPALSHTVCIISPRCREGPLGGDRL